MTLKEMQADLLKRAYDAAIKAAEEAENSYKALIRLRETANCFNFALPKIEEDG